MGCASSQSSSIPGNTDPGQLAAVDNSTNPTTEPSADKYPPAEAFEISLDDVNNDNDVDKNDSLIKKHPPKRLQKLVEQAATAVPSATIEHLEEKLAKAEVRRQQYIQQKIENIITLTSKGGGSNSEGGDGGDGGGNNDQNDGQNDDGDNTVADGKAVIVSNSPDVVQPTTSTSNKIALSTDEHAQIDGDHNADNRTLS